VIVHHTMIFHGLLQMMMNQHDDDVDYNDHEDVKMATVIGY